MSASDEKISNVIDDDDDDDEDEDEYDDVAIGKKQRRTTGCGIGKAKQVVSHQFTKAKRQIRRIRSKKALLPSSSSSSRNATTITSSGKKNKMISGSGCKFCFSRPKVLESPDRSPSSDPNDPNFTYAMLRTLIANNDFYSKDCNPHLD